jgi:tetratricopeptide (TPR) repeat protein
VSTSALLNPYIAGNPVSGPEMFFGRDDVFEWLRAVLRGRHRDNAIALYGQPRTGKTSTLYQLKHRLGERYVSVFVDLHGLALESFDGFLWELTNSIARSLAQDYGLSVPRLSSTEFKQAPREAFEDVFLGSLWTAVGHRHVVLMIDEALRLQEQVTAGKLDAQVFGYLRYLMQHYERLNFLFAFTRGLEEIESEFSVLFSGALYKRISFLDRDSTVRLITQPVESFFRVDERAQDRVYELTSGQPYFTQLVCHSMFERWRRSQPAVLGAADVDMVLDEAIERGLAVLKHVWEESGPVEKVVLAGMAAALRAGRRTVTGSTVKKVSTRTPSNLSALDVDRALERLVRRDVLKCTDRYAFAVDLQRRWLARERPLSRALEEVHTAPAPAATPVPLQEAQDDSRPAIFRCAYPFPQPTDLIGRDAELASLRELIERGRTKGQAVLISGAAGAGKSALLGKVIGEAQEAGVLCLAGGSYDASRIGPLAPFEEALTDFLLSEAANQVSSRVSTARSELVDVVAELRRQLGIGSPRASSDGTSGRMRLFGAVLALVRSLAGPGPVLLCLEDLHAADAATLHLFHYLIRQTRLARVAILGTFREDELLAGEPLAQLVTLLARDRLAQRVRLGPLGPVETTRLVAALAGRSVSSAVASSLYSASEGNPLFVEQLVYALRDGPGLEHASDLGERGESPTATMPNLIREIIDQRLLRLSPRGRRLLESAAVLGQTFDYPTLLTLVRPARESSVLAELDEAIRMHLLRETDSGYAFAHTLLREGVYWGLTGPRRMFLHRQAGETLERLAGDSAAEDAAELAYHFGRAGLSRRVGAKALRYSVQAGRRAAGLSSYREALIHFGKAAELLDRPGATVAIGLRLEVLQGRERAERELARWSESIRTSRQILTLPISAMDRATARGQIAYALLHTGDMSGVLEQATAATAEVAEVSGPDAAAFRLYLRQMFAFVRYLQGCYRELVDFGHELLRDAERLASPTALMRAHLVISWGYMGQGQVPAALAHKQLAVLAAEQAGDKIELAIAYENRALQNYLGGRLGEAHADVDRALAIFRESASELRAINAIQHQCRIWVAQGELDRAREQASLAVELAIAGEERWAADCNQLLAVVAVLRAEWDPARRHVEQALAIRERVGDMAGIVESLVSLGSIEQNVGHWTTAHSVYEKAVATANRMDPGPLLVRARRHLGRLRLLAGDYRKATLEIEAAFQVAQQMTESLEYAPTLLAMAELRLQIAEPQQALALASRALDCAIPVEDAQQAHLVAAQVHLRLNNFQLAREHANAAVEGGERLRAPRLLSLGYLELAQVNVAGSLWEQAIGSFEQALNFAEAAGSRFERAMVLKAYAESVEAATLPTSKGRSATAMALESRSILQALTA